MAEGVIDDNGLLYFESHPHDSRVTGPYNVAMTLSAKYGTGGNNTPLVLEQNNIIYNKNRNEQFEEEDVAMTLTEKLECKSGNEPIVPLVRKLTPTECARLQGFPDDWCSDVKHTDSAEYIMWGNGIALPCLLPMMKAMRDILNREEKE